LSLRFFFAETFRSFVPNSPLQYSLAYIFGHYDRIDLNFFGLWPKKKLALGYLFLRYLQQNQSKKFSGRKIPIQVISDPFKVRAGDRAIHRDGVTSPYQVSVAASNSSPNHPAPTKQRTGSSFSSCNDRVNDVYRPVSGSGGRSITAL